MPTYFVTGSARGIGLELVHQLTLTPSDFVIAAVRSTSPGLFSLQRERSNLRIVPCDVSSEASILSLRTILPDVLPPDGKVDYLLNNAAINAGPETRDLTVTAAALNENIKTNVLGPARIVSTLETFLAPNALVVNLTAGVGSLTLVSNGTIPAIGTAYSISKCALNMLTVHQANALKGTARVVCLDPGHVKTNMGGEDAVVEIADSAKGIREVVEMLKEGEQEEADRTIGRARFFNFQGEEVPW